MLYAIMMKDGAEFQVEAESPSDARGVSAWHHKQVNGKNSYCVRAVPVTMCEPLKLVEA